MSLLRALFIPDAHIPFENKRAWNLVLKVGEDFKPNVLVVIGDLGDFCAVSSHSKDPLSKLGYKKEVAAVNKALDQLDTLGAKRKIFLAGNHENRLTRYLQDKAPELFEMHDIPSTLGLQARGWEYTPYKQYARLGKLYLTHDAGYSGRNAVFQSMQAFEHSVVTGHSHRLAYVVEGNAAGEYKVSTQFGWLGDVNKVDYLNRVKAYKDWALGFGIGHIATDTGIAYLTPIPIVRNSCCVNGKLYKG